MKSRTKIKSQSSRKTNSELAETIQLALKNKPWNPIAAILSGPTRQYSKINLEKIEKHTKLADTIVIPGKVLSQGNLSKKVRIAALSFSEKAKNKLKESKSEIVSILEEIKKNPKFEGVKIIR